MSFFRVSSLELLVPPSGSFLSSVFIVFFSVCSLALVVPGSVLFLFRLSNGVFFLVDASFVFFACTTLIMLIICSAFFSYPSRCLFTTDYLKSFIDLNVLVVVDSGSLGGIISNSFGSFSNSFCFRTYFAALLLALLVYQVGSTASSRSSSPLLAQLIQVILFALTHLLSFLLLFLYFYNCSFPFTFIMLFVPSPALFFAFITFSANLSTPFSLGTPTSCSTAFRYSCDGLFSIIHLNIVFLFSHSFLPCLHCS